VVGAVKVIVVTVVVVVDTIITVDVAAGALTIAELVASLLFEIVAKTVDVAVEVVNEATSASDVVLNLDGAVVETPSTSEMTTVSWKSNSISGKVGVMMVRSMFEHERPIPQLYSRARHLRIQ